MAATRDDEEVAATLGIRTDAYKLFAFGLSGAFAGLIGSFFAIFFSFVDPSQASTEMSFNILIWLIVGGVGTCRRSRSRRRVVVDLAPRNHRHQSGLYPRPLRHRADRERDSQSQRIDRDSCHCSGPQRERHSEHAFREQVSAQNWHGYAPTENCDVATTRPKHSSASTPTRAPASWHGRTPGLARRRYNRHEPPLRKGMM